MSKVDEQVAAKIKVACGSLLLQPKRFHANSGAPDSCIAAAVAGFGSDGFYIFSLLSTVNGVVFLGSSDWREIVPV